MKKKKGGLLHPPNRKEKSGLTQNKPLVATEGEAHWGWRLGPAHRERGWAGGSQRAVQGVGVSGVVQGISRESGD